MRPFELSINLLTAVLLKEAVLLTVCGTPAVAPRLTPPIAPTPPPTVELIAERSMPKPLPPAALEVVTAA